MCMCWLLKFENTFEQMKGLVAKGPFLQFDPSEVQKGLSTLIDFIAPWLKVLLREQTKT